MLGSSFYVKLLGIVARDLNIIIIIIIIRHRLYVIYIEDLRDQ